MNLQQALSKASKKLEESKIKEPRLDAEVLLAFVLKKDKTFLYSHPEAELVDEESYFDLIYQRSKHKPLAYITKSKEFYGREFIVTTDTLIPRPETELLIDYVLEDAKKLKQAIILDVGTGSGCIAITLKAEIPDSEISASDISKNALTIASKNAEKLSVVINFKESNLLEKIDTQQDIVIANLPYLAQEDIDSSPTQQDLTFEPQLALIAGDDGLDLIKKLITDSSKILSTNGLIFLELLPRQINILKDWLAHNDLGFSFHALNDYNNQSRFIKLIKT